MDEKTIVFEPKEEYKRLEKNPIAFFCAEYAFDEDSSMYAGGLGVLAGDFILESAEEGLPFVALGLWYGGPKNPIRSKEFSLIEREGNPLIIDIPCGKEKVKARVWARRFGKSTYLMLLDTNVIGNLPENQTISGHLYDPNFIVNLKQKAVLGIGGIKLLQNLGVNPSIYHLNEGHTAFAALELIVELKKKNPSLDFGNIVSKVKEKIVATKHTIFSIAGPSMRDDELYSLISSYCEENSINPKDIFALGAREDIKNVFSTTQFLLNCAIRQNGVSILHTMFEQKIHPQSVLFPITNGVYEKRWQASVLQIDTSTLSDDVLWRIKKDLRASLVNFVAMKTGVILDPNACTVVWSRRFAAYKRPELLFSDIERLKKISSGDAKVQFIISGKAHESDIEGQKTLEKIKSMAKDIAFKNKIVYLPDYSITVATELVLGADVWLNTPNRGFEACGTSGMKAGLNCALQASVSDGWIGEVDWKNIGFILSESNTAVDIYNSLENDIIPLFYKRDDKNVPKEWVSRMRQTKSIVENGFTAKRMLKDYITKSYMVI